MYITNLADVSYVYFETDVDNDGVMLDIEFNINNRDSSKSKLLSSYSHELTDISIEVSHDQWREMASVSQGLMLSKLKFKSGYVISFKILYDMLSRCTLEYDNPLSSLRSSIEFSKHDIAAHNAVMDFHISRLENSIEHLKIHTM